MESRCYLGNLSFTVTERAIRDLLESQNFVIRRVHIVRKGTWFGGHPLCSAFLTLASDSEVQRMVEMLNGILHLPLSPIALKAEKAVPRMRWVSQDPQMSASFKAFDDGYDGYEAVPYAADSAGSAKAEVKEAADDDEIKAEEGAQGQDCGEDNDEDDKTTLVLGEGGSDDSGVDDMLPSPKPPQETEATTEPKTEMKEKKEKKKKEKRTSSSRSRKKRASSSRSRGRRKRQSSSSRSRGHRKRQSSSSSRSRGHRKRHSSSGSGHKKSYKKKARSGTRSRSKHGKKHRS